MNIGDKKLCPNCNEEVSGCIDRVFCTTYCKTNFHYEKNKEKINVRFKEVDLQLKLNRKILRNFNKAGKATIRYEKMIESGFNPSIFTNYWKNSKGDVYLFCYEYGFLKKSENGQEKFILVMWQNYMI